MNLIKRDPRFIGFNSIFDDIFSSFDKKLPAYDKFPPYDILRLDESNTELHFAVAGYSKDDIDIEVSNNILTVSGTSQEDQEKTESIYSHRGIARRSFSQKFTISDSTEVVPDPELKDGILVIKLKTELPKVPEVKKLTIK